MQKYYMLFFLIPLSIISHGPGMALVHVARKKEQEKRRKKGIEMKPIITLKKKYKSG